MVVVRCNLVISYLIELSYDKKMKTRRGGINASQDDHKNCTSSTVNGIMEYVYMDKQSLSLVLVSDVAFFPFFQ